MIYLSICIPTYNRSNYLQDVLESFVNEPEFIETDEIEIVISDNCSTDNTESIAREYVNKYPTKIKYNRNSENIVDGNFEKVLSMGSGAILKLNNDTLVLNKGSLAPLLQNIKYCCENNLTPFLLNGTMPVYKEPIVCKNASSFIATVSYSCTWIGGFCISRESFQKIDNFSQEYSLQLVQVDVLMRLLKKGCEFLVIPDKFYQSIVPAKKGGYNLPKVFLTNYFKILRKYLVSTEEIKVLREEKRIMLFKFVLPWIVTISNDANKKASNFTFDISGYKEVVKKEFSALTYLEFEFTFLIKFILFSSKAFLKSIINTNTV
ncbi:Glycosyl transferase family 2 [Mucilaginibacter mallensis]|uniref:Glycosyl transferase family 2 n=2 Tax=Mucilaginibacter mallensis TaxID=652787 RepID=A0A1H2ALT6_MUCMA|nr:Glycosyl transferase family 2 [Mucilaginibacter mallensis]